MKCPDCGHENLEGAEDCASCRSPMAALSDRQPSTGMRKKILDGRVGELELHAALSVPETATVAQAVALMRERKMGCVLVLRGAELAGLFSERDVLMSTAGKDPSSVRVGDVMRVDRETLSEDHPTTFAFHQMTVHDQRHVPVRRKDGSLAVVSARDILRYLCA